MKNNDGVSPPYLILGAIFWGFAFLIAVLVQFVVLPYFLPYLHGGEGLLAHTDSVQTHILAREMANNIHQVGWSAWQFNPRTGTGIGITALFYVIFSPHPWVLIPFYSLIHALAALL